jgi:hypothetical protein
LNLAIGQVQLLWQPVFCNQPLAFFSTAQINEATSARNRQNLAAQAFHLRCESAAA